MTATLSKTQAELPKLVEIASQGEDVVITVEGKPKARLTRVNSAEANGNKTVVDIGAWLKDLDDVRRKFATGKQGISTEQILDEDRSDRI